MKKILALFALIAVLLASHNSLALEQSVADTAQLIGKYSCSFTQYSGDEVYAYPPFRCTIVAKGDHLELEKLSGSQRIKGNIAIHSHGFSFEGVYFCPMGDCTAKVLGDFTQLQEGVYKGEIYNPDSPNDKTRVDLKKTK